MEKVLILYSTAAMQQVDDIVNMLDFAKIPWRVISATSRTPGSCLILPDTGGLNLNSGALFPHFDLPPNFPGQCQKTEHFRIHTLEWYVNKAIPLVGIGTGGLMVWDSVLKGKLTVDVSGELVPLDLSGCIFPKRETDWSFFKLQCFGFRDLPPDLTTYIKTHYYKDKGPKGAMVTATLPEPTAPLGEGAYIIE